MFSGSSRAGSSAVPDRLPSQDEVSAKFALRPTSTSGEVAIDGTTMFGTLCPSSALATHSEESGTQRSGRLSLPLATSWATFAEGAALMVNCRHGVPSLPPLLASDLAAASSEDCSSGVVLNWIWAGSSHDLPPPRKPSAPDSDPKERTTNTAPSDSTSSPTAVMYTDRRLLLLLRVTAEECFPIAAGPSLPEADCARRLPGFGRSGRRSR